MSKLTDKQRKLDVNMDGEIDSTDLKNLREGEEPDADYVKSAKAIAARLHEKASAVETSYSELKTLVTPQSLIGIDNIVKKAILSTSSFGVEVSKEQGLVTITALKGVYVTISVDDLYKYKKIGGFSSVELEVAGGDFSIMFFGVNFK